ncbi:MAG TPA: M28 family peptidase, partial [Gemmatimonadales bacterium]|nr:M28 family peptidase [Gemmatimonadales bacterium]
MRHLLHAAILAFVTVLSACAQGARQSSTPVPGGASTATDAWWGHVTALAHDSMRGRETASPEHRQAADYVAAAFARAGLEPGGSEGFLQPVRFVRRRVLEERSSLALVRNGVAEPLEFGTEATISLRSSRSGSVDAPLVFVGYAMRAPEQGIDDFTGVDLRGKVAVIMAGVAPQGMSGPALAAARGAGAGALFTSGAVGVVSILSPRSDLPWSRYAASRLQPQMRLAEADAGHGGPSLIAAAVNPERAERLFAGAPRSYADLLALADSGAPLPGFALPMNLRATVAVEESDAVSHNVVGLLRGADPALREEYVVLTAHLDHLGVSEPVDGDSIFNGAMDNASGIATLIETARLVAGRAEKPRRSVAFVAVTAEEHGLLGSDAF